MRIRLLIAFIMLFLVSLAAVAPYLDSHGDSALYEFFRGVCHQRSERCFHLFGYPMALCARCVSIYVGIGLGSLLMPLVVQRRTMIVGLLVSLVLMGVERLLEFLNIFGVDVYLRAFTGFLFGVSLSMFLLAALTELFDAKKLHLNA